MSRDAENELKPVWTVGGTRIVFASSRGERPVLNLYWRRADGSGAAERLTESPNAQQPSSWHPSGKALAFEAISPVTGADVVFLPLEGSEAAVEAGEADDLPQWQVSRARCGVLALWTRSR